jgi:hypothetical protein
MFSTIRTVAFERIDETLIRMIAFETDEDTGARSVADIYVSGSRDKDYAFIARIAADYTNQSNTDVEYFGYVDGKQVPMAEFDTGRARKLQSKIQRMIQEI